MKNAYQWLQENSRFEHHVCSPSLSLICLVNLGKSALQKKVDKIIRIYCNVVDPGFTDHLLSSR